MGYAYQPAACCAYLRRRAAYPRRHALYVPRTVAPQAPVGVVCDGCRELDPDHAARLSARLEADPMRFSKRGIVSQGVAASYALYKQRLASPSGGRPRDRPYRVTVRVRTSST